MKTPSILLMIILVIGSLVSSCNPEDDDDNNDGTNVLADLTFSYTVIGEITQSGNWESPENDQNLGGHDNSVLSNHSGITNEFLIVGIGSDYSFSIESNMAVPSVGSHAIQDAIFSDNQSSFESVVSGTLQLDEVTVNYEIPPTVTYYTASGSFTTDIENSATPPETVTFSGTFEGLNVSATN